MTETAAPGLAAPAQTDVSHRVSHTTTDWWRSAVIYQVYPRSFADHSGNGVGDLRGIIDRLPYLSDLGVDALWLNPFYCSPQNDAGYDVANYYEVDPLFGSTRDAEELIIRAHELNLRVIFDIVPNHTSIEHAWFRQALLTAPGSAAWNRYHCVRGLGEDGSRPPNDWRSVFGGSGWSQILDPDTAEPTGWWYLHLFDATQPDLNWDHEDVRAEHEQVLKFWFDRGVDGFRIDVAHGLVKSPGYPFSGESDRVLGVADDVPVLPQWDQPGVHDVYRSWRRLADSYDPPRVFCGEVWVSTPEAQAQYLRPDELHTAFNFHYLKTRWDAEHLRETIDHSLATADSVSAPCTWVLSNHDVWRHVSRLAPENPQGNQDLSTGMARARAASLIMLALPGSAYLYQGEELGLPEVLDLPAQSRQDPIFARTDGAALGRDGCRVPLPWTAQPPTFGFNSTGQSWLPQPDMWGELSVETQLRDADSCLSMYRQALALRADESIFNEGTLEWLSSPVDTIAFRRPGRDSVIAVMNLSDEPLTWMAQKLLLASSSQVTAEPSTQNHALGLVVTLAPNTAAWVRE